MGIPLVIDNAKLKELREFAEMHPFPVAELRRIAAFEAPCAGDRPGYMIELPVGFRVVYSIEEHPQHNGSTRWLRHMSVSIKEPTRKRVPSIEAIELLSAELGFPPLDQCHIDTGRVDGDEPVYVEVLALKE